MTDEELAVLRQQADESSMSIPMLTKAQLRELLAAYDLVSGLSAAEVMSLRVIRNDEYVERIEHSGKLF